MDAFEAVRLEMVERTIQARGITDPLIIESFKKVPRHEFVPADLHYAAYFDSPLPIGEEQTISQPFIVALMTAAAKINSESKILEIGTGSGYACAILAHIAKQVYSVERIETLGKQAKERLQRLGLSNIEVKIDDGTLGWPEKGPFDAIIATAAAPIVPESLKAQLKDGGRLIIPVGGLYGQQLLRLTKNKDQLIQEILEPVRFVPLIGKEGWQESK
ncbi:MAG: protein-L-isoaspartate(D-aspartate) O-methyltransferase [Parachlamydiaceae bacterium]